MRMDGARRNDSRENEVGSQKIRAIDRAVQYFSFQSESSSKKKSQRNPKVNPSQPTVQIPDVKIFFIGY